MIPTLNLLGTDAFRAGLAMLAQSAVLALALLVFDRIARHRVRATLRGALWFLVVVKLVLPPSLLVPTGIGFWAGRWIAAPIVVAATPRLDVAFPEPNPDTTNPVRIPTASSSRPGLEPAGLLLLGWIAGSLSLAGWMWRRNRDVRRLLDESIPAPTRFLESLGNAARELGLRRPPELRLTTSNHSPAVCGPWRPVVVLPASMAESLGAGALRDVLLHELAHVQRRDLWLNFFQTLVQIVWWWNPVAWLANARIRTLREESVDERVMLLQPGDDASYPSTLVEIARHCSAAPALALGFVGILESPNALKPRVRRLLEQPLPRRARLGVAGWMIVGAAAMLALPMAHARRVETATLPASKGNPPATNDPAASLFTRVFRVNQRQFIEAIQSVLGQPSRHDAPTTELHGAALQQSLQEFFVAAGVPLQPFGVGTNAPDGATVKTAFYNERAGTLFVRATPAELDIVEKALQVLNIAPPQVTIESLFVEVDPDEAKAAGCDLFFEDHLVGAVGTASDAKSKSNLLDSDKVRWLLSALKRCPSANVIETPKVTTLSGRKAQTSVEFSSVSVRSDHATNRIALGPTLDITAFVEPDGQSIVVDLLVALTEFGGNTTDLAHQPVTTSRYIPTRAVVHDGQTLVLGSLARPGGGKAKELLVFVTTTIIDPAGNRMNPPKPAAKPGR